MPEETQKLQRVVFSARGRASDKLSDIWSWMLERFVLALGLAVFALAWPQQTVGILVKLLGGYILIDGLLGAFGAFRSGRKSGMPAIALIRLVVGAMLVFWTDLRMRLFLMLLGNWALIQGVRMFFYNRNKASNPEARNLIGLVGGILPLVGLILVLWPSATVVTVSWLLAGLAFLIGFVMVFESIKLQRVVRQIDDYGFGLETPS